MTLTPHRVGYLQAMGFVIEELKNGIPMSISLLSQKLNIDRRTIGKVIDALLDVQETLVNHEIQTTRSGKNFVIEFKKRANNVLQILSNTLSVVKRKSSFSILKRGD
ncbi:MAG: hypothetical protein ACTSRU_18990 [Candidatus Hodarchaeales archaeon]